MSELKQVKASAGSGKTYQLTRRFLTLLDASDDATRPFVCTNSPGKGFSWPEIMAVTFTNKAAAEMKERVVDGLKASALSLDDTPACSPETARHTLNAILRRYHRLNIRTIDSLLVLLLRLFALEFGIRPDFEIVFDERELFNAIFDHYMGICETEETEHALLSNALTTLIIDEGRAGFWVQNTIRERLRELTNCLDSHKTSVLIDQGAIKDLLAAEYATLVKAVDRMQSHLAETGLPVHANFPKLLAKYDGLGLFDTPESKSAYLYKETLYEFVNKAGKSMVDDRAEAIYASFKETCLGYANAHAILAGAYFLAPAIQIALRLMNGLDELQRQRGMVLNSNVAGHVINLLGGDGTVF